MAQRFDADTGNLSGRATLIAKANNFSATSDSILAYQGASSTARLEWFDRSGNPLGTLGEVAEYYSPKISPDGKQVLARVVNTQTGTDELWSFPVSGAVSTRLTFGSGMKTYRGHVRPGCAAYRRTTACHLSASPIKPSKREFFAVPVANRVLASLSNVTI